MPRWPGVGTAGEPSTDGGLVPRGALSPFLRDEGWLLGRKTSLRQEKARLISGLSEHSIGVEGPMRMVPGNSPSPEHQQGL